MSEQAHNSPDAAETLQQPHNVEVLSAMLTDEYRGQRTQWLQDHLKGEHDSSIGHVVRLMERKDAYLEKSAQAWEKYGDAEASIKAKQAAENAEALMERTFGRKSVLEYYQTVMGIEGLKADPPRVDLWGKEAAHIYSELTHNTEMQEDGIDRKHTVPPAQKPEATSEDYARYLGEKRFISNARLELYSGDERLSLHIPAGETVEIPVANIVSAGSFDSWAGGSGGKSYERADGVIVNEARSIDVIKHYASLPTEIPPLETITMFIQPDGKALYEASVSNHRTAAAIARGQEYVKVKGNITVKKLTRNILDEYPVAVKTSEHSGDSGESEKPEAPAERLIASLDAYDPTHRLGSPDFRRQLLESTTPQEAAIVVAEIHKILYGDKAQIWHETVTLGKDEGSKRKVGFVGVHPDDRADLFAYAFEKVQKLAAEGNLERAAALAGGTIVALQTFRDGNKRTSRAVYKLIAEGYDGSEADRQAITEMFSYTQEARQTVLFSPQMHWNIDAFQAEGRSESDIQSLNKWVMLWGEDQPTREEFRDLLPIADGSIKEQLIDVLQQNEFGVAELIRQIDGAPGIINTPGGISESRRLALNAIRKIDETKAQEILARDRGIKKEFVLRMIDATTGERPFYRTAADGSKEINPWINITGHSLE